MLLGDTHGNTGFIVNQVIPAAKAEGVHWIYQLGDFGYWEHTIEGVSFLDEVNEALILAGLEIVFIQGNHDKISLLLEKYQQIAGFYKVRSNLWFAPNGTQWEMGGKSFLALGGAYSIDKDVRLKTEEQLAQKNLRYSNKVAEGYSVARLLEMYRESARGTYWFPEEEMTDSDMDTILQTVETPVDVILAHDKPIMSNPLAKLLTIAEVMSNQRRLQKAVNVLKPKLFIHGHLHIRYTDTIRCGDDNMYTRVEGLGADVPNFNQLEKDWRPSDAWEILHLEG